MYVWETYDSGISTSSLKLDLEMTSLVFQKYLRPLTLHLHGTEYFPLLTGLLEQAVVISRCPNKHLHSILSQDVKQNIYQSKFVSFIPMSHYSFCTLF